jgi:hypothetical protein
MRAAIVALLLSMAASGMSGCVHPQHLSNFAADSTMGSPVRLVVWNGEPTNVNVVFGDLLLYSGEVPVSRTSVGIGLYKQVYVKAGAYRVTVSDLTHHLESSMVVRVRSVVNVNVMLTRDTLHLFTDEERNPVYQ